MSSTRRPHESRRRRSAEYVRPAAPHGRAGRISGLGQRAAERLRGDVACPSQAALRAGVQGRRQPGPRPPARCAGRSRCRSQHIYEDAASGRLDKRPGLDACLKALRRDDTLVIWKLDRLRRDLRHLVNTVGDLTKRSIGLKVLAGEGASIDTTTANGRLIFAIFAGLAKFERELLVERTRAGLESARARGRHGGRPFKMTPAKLRLTQAAMGKPETKVAELCAELGVTRQTLYRHVTPKGDIRPDGEKLLARKMAR